MQPLQPKLHRGMQYVAENAETTGCMSLRIMTDPNAGCPPRAETSVAAMLFMGREEATDAPRSKSKPNPV